MFFFVVCRRSVSAGGSGVPLASDHHISDSSASAPPVDRLQLSSSSQSLNLCMHRIPSFFRTVFNRSGHCSHYICEQRIDRNIYFLTYTWTTVLCVGDCVGCTTTNVMLHRIFIRSFCARGAEMTTQILLLDSARFPARLTASFNNKLG